MEYGLSETFPIYSGGLGVLAGDILKTAKDLNLPMIGIGILWREGHTDQYLDKNGFPDCPQDYDRSHLRTQDHCGRLIRERTLPAKSGRPRLSAMCPCTC